MNHHPFFSHARQRRIATLSAALAGLLFAGLVPAATLTVKAGESIQAAVGRANAGDRIEIMPGTYRETVFIDKDRIDLRGIIVGGKWPVLDGEGKLNDGILAAGHGVTIENMWVKRYKGNGIMTQGSNNYRIVHNVVEGPCFYAIFPQFGKNGLVAYNVTSQSEDSAIYVGMSANVDVIHNETYDNVIGIEAENSTDVLIENNIVHDNTLGVLLSMLPALPVKTADNIIVRHNFISHNNARNIAPAGAVTAGVPGGVGILVLGVHHTAIEGNFIRDHDSAGVLVAQTSFVIAIPDEKINPLPENVQILSNLFINNGGAPRDMTKDLIESAGLTRGVDVLATIKGNDNCLADRASLATLGTNRYADCAPGTTSAAVVSMQTREPVAAPVFTAEQKGRLTYLAVCSGCHTYDSKLVGPPMIAIKALYGKDAQRLADWIAKPIRRWTAGASQTAARGYAGVF